VKRPAGAKPQMWFKVYRVALMVCAAVLVVTVAALTVANQRTAFDRELSRALNEHEMVRRSMESTISVLVRHDRSAEQAARLSFSYASLPGIGLALLDEGGAALQSTMPEGLAVSFYEGEQRATVLKTFEGVRYLMAQGALSVEDKTYQLLYARPVDALYAEGRQWGLTMGLACLGALALLGALLFYFIWRTLAPLGAVSAAAADIAQGDYDRRAQGANVEEIDRLSGSLNRMAAAVQAHIAELTAKNKAQQQLIADLAHEMKTPMSSIIGYAGLLRRANMPGESREKALQYIESEGARLERLSLRLMDLSQLNAGAQLHIERVPVRELIDGAIQSLEPKIAQGGREIVTDIRWDALDCDRELMLSLLINLIDNALKYAPEGTPIQVKCACVDGQLSLSVHDAGRSVPPDQAEALKQPFFMMDKARTRRQQGAGLGLSLCERIAEVHGGKLEIRSDETGFTAGMVLQLENNLETIPENAGSILYPEPGSEARKGREPV